MTEFLAADFQHVSLMDYPGKISSIVFTRGCSLRCRYCHNPGLVTGRACENRLPDFLDYIEGKDIEAVAVTGGEPLVAPGLADFLEEMKARGLMVKLDTNGCHPQALERLLFTGLVDYAAVDLKAFNDEDFRMITRTEGSLEKFYRTAEILEKYGVEYEVRHTVWKTPSEKDADAYAAKLPDALFYMQKIRPAVMLDKSFKPTADHLETERILSDRLRNFRVRGV